MRQMSNRITLSEIEMWVRNDEGLYNWWKSERKGLKPFIRDNRAALESAINHAMNRDPA